MTLFKCSNPQRLNADRILPALPTEIYLYLIFGYIVPPTGHLTQEEVLVLTKLSLVCRLFANICLPRAFEFIELSGPVFGNTASVGLGCGSQRCKVSRETLLCAHILANHPLALSISKFVTTCHFTNWLIFETSSSALKQVAGNYTIALSHMTNIRELCFSSCFVHDTHWRAIEALGSLEKLSFDACIFEKGLSNAEVGKKGKIKVSRLAVVACDGCVELIEALDLENIPFLSTDFVFLRQIAWPRNSALTELELRSVINDPMEDWGSEQVDVALRHVPESVAKLSLYIDDVGCLSQVTGYQGLFDNPVWRNLFRLCSIKLHIVPGMMDRRAPECVLSSALNVLRFLPGLQSFTLDGSGFRSEMACADMQWILGDKINLRVSSRLMFADVYGKGFRLVNGRWLPA